MNPYLATIAARSAQSGTQSLVPTVSEPTVFDERSRIAENEDFQENESLQQNPEPVQPAQIQPARSPEIKNKVPVDNRGSEIAYFSKHVERLNNVEVGNTFRDNPLETEGIESEEPSKWIDTIADPVNPKDSVPSPNTNSNTVSPKKENEKQITIKPPDITAEMGTSDEPSKLGKMDEPIRPVGKQKGLITPSMDEIQKDNKLIPKKTPIDRLIPNMEGNENNRLIQNKKQTANPTLVIGKIIVEVLPPKPNLPPKIIKKVVSQPSQPISSKSNKLIFGLGQM